MKKNDYLCRQITTTMNLKQQILLVIGTFFALTAQAQELTVKEMQATNDLSASQYRHNDFNGEPCALIKVQLATTGATFEGNVIKPVEYKSGEYWVYMPGGNKELMVKHPSFLPLHINFADHGIKSVQSLVTYRLTLLIPQLSGIEIDDGMRYFVMSVEPANATVYIDDQPQVVQNGTLSILLPMGEHRYKVESTAYEPKSGTFTIGNEKLTLPIKLQSNMATLNVGSTTQGTQIYVNDQLRGSSSWSGSLPAGTYRIEGRLKGYRNHRQNIQLSQRENKQVTIPALQAITGALNVNYMPANAEVWLDGKKIGTSPDVFRNIIIGSHQLEIKKDGYFSEQKSITIDEGHTSQLSGSLNKITTHVKLATSPLSSSESAETINHQILTAKQMVDNALGFLPINEFKNKSLKETFEYVNRTYPSYKAGYNLNGRNITIWESSKGSYTPHYHDLGFDMFRVDWNINLNEITGFEYSFIQTDNATNVINVLVNELNQLGCNMKQVTDSSNRLTYRGKRKEWNIIVKLDKQFGQFIYLEIRSW